MTTQAQQTTTGWVVFIAGLGMMCGMMAVDIAQLMNFHEMITPTFIGSCMGHFAAVITAFCGGKLIPEQRESSTFSRTDDPKHE